MIRTPVFIFILYNFFPFILNYKGDIKIYFFGEDDFLSLKIGNEDYIIQGKENFWDYSRDYSRYIFTFQTTSGEKIISECTTGNDQFLIFAYFDIYNSNQKINIDFNCNCPTKYPYPASFENYNFNSYDYYQCNSNVICTALTPFYCEDLNLIFYATTEESSSISNITFYFNNDSYFYIIPEDIPENVNIYCDDELMVNDEYYNTSCEFRFESSFTGTYIFSFNAVDIYNHTNIKSIYPCNITLIICFKGCKTCLGENNVTLTTQNCTSCYKGYIFFENETNVGCCFSNTTEIDGYYINYNESKYKKCHEFCLKCKNNNTNCSKCKKGYAYYNFQCLTQCPIGTHLNEEGNLCICNYKFYIDDFNMTFCLNKEENCDEKISYPFLLNGECLKKCKKEYPYSFNNICYSKCPSNSIANDDDKICECKNKYYKENKKLFCLNENEECSEKYPFLIFNENECVKSCDELKLFIFNNKCLSTCDGNKIISDNKKYCKCKFNYYIKNSFNYCLNENEKCPEDFLYLYENKICVNKCPENYLSFNYECIKNCTENYYEFNLTCVQTCPENYYKTINRKCENADCLERDLNENILLIHENNYEEFKGKNTCDFDNKNYNYFIAEIYDSNIILNNSNNKTSFNLNECENILKKNYNIPENKSLTIFKIDYYFENSSFPKMEYKIFNNDKILNLSYCENVSFTISKPVNIENLNIDISKFNETLNYPEIDIFDINSNFFNDICSTFTSSDKTDIPLGDRKKDYFQNVTLCEDGCIYDSFNKTSFKVNCICGNTQLKIKNIEDNINNLFSNSNLKLLKCVSIYLTPKNYFKNLGIFIFKTVELIEIILFFFTLYNGFLPIIIFIKLNKNNIYFKNKTTHNNTNNNPPKKNKEISFSINNFNNKKNKLPIKNIIIYKDINVLEDNFNNSKHILVTKKKDILEKHKIFTNEEINILNYEKSLLIDNRSLLKIYYSFLKYSQLIIFTFITNSDFNLRKIKISLFIFSFVLFLTFNTLFFTDESMSHIYKQGGSFDFIYNLPKTIFSGICCGVINFLLKFLSLSQKDIEKFNKMNEKDKSREINKYKKYWYCKIIIFYFLIFIFIELFQIYVGTFCTIYKNTQKHLIKSTTISFILSMIYPFGICLLTAILRKISLVQKNKFLFLLSKLLQMF